MAADTTARRTLIATTLLTALIVGAAFLTIDWLHSTAADAVEHPGPAATDAQSEVVGQAKDIVAIAGLAQPTADYSLVSCSTRGVLHMHGQCRNTTDHRGDSSAWMDVTERLR